MRTFLLHVDLLFCFATSLGSIALAQGAVTIRAPKKVVAGNPAKGVLVNSKRIPITVCVIYHEEIYHEDDGTQFAENWKHALFWLPVMPAQLDIESDHWAVNVDAIVPNSPTRILRCGSMLGQIQI